MEEALNLLAMIFSVGSISFGGGWSVVGIIQDQLVSGGWMTVEEFARIITISQLVPGPVALNSATQVGLNHGGFVLAALSATALVLPGALVILAGRWVLEKGWLKQANLVRALGVASLALLSFTLFRLVNNPLVEWWMFPIAALTAVLNLRTRLPALVVVFLGLGLGILGSLFVY